MVDGEAAPFEMSDLGDGYWAAIGRLTDAIVTIDSRGVPISAVRLERLASRRPPSPAPPDIGERSAAVMQALDERPYPARCGDGDSSTTPRASSLTDWVTSWAEAHNSLRLGLLHRAAFVVREVTSPGQGCLPVLPRTVQADLDGLE